MPTSDRLWETSLALSTGGNCSVRTKYLNAAFKYPLPDSSFTDAHSGSIGHIENAANVLDIEFVGVQTRKHLRFFL